MNKLSNFEYFLQNAICYVIPSGNILSWWYQDMCLQQHCLWCPRWRSYWLFYWDWNHHWLSPTLLWWWWLRIHHLLYYGGDGFPLRNICQLFHSCEETLMCTECVSETKGCYNFCSKNIIGAIDDNMLDFIPNIGTERDCRELCGDRSGCEYYTFYLETDP